MTDPQYHDFFERLITDTRERYREHPGCHDWDHTARVLRNAQMLAERERADRRIVETAAVLHDVGRLEEINDRGITCHAALGAELTPGILANLGMHNTPFIEAVRHCVEAHRYRQRDTASPATLEACCVFDADKLDCLGAAGIGRAFHFAGREGARLHNTETEALAGKSYGREDTAYREYLFKLRNVPDHMLTTTGRELAVRRHRFMVEFFEELNRECGQ